MLALVLLVAGCDGVFPSHRKIMEKDLALVSYDNGIAITEAKTIADAYLYVYGSREGSISHAKIRDGGAKWVGDVYGGPGVSPAPLGMPPLEIDKATGEVVWANGPTVQRVDLTGTL